MKLMTIGLLATTTFLGIACSNGEPDVTPTISITSPMDGKTVTLGTGAKLSLPLIFSVTNFALQVAGSSGCGLGCGHVHLLIDGSSCNTGSLSYNTEGIASPLDAEFASCATPTGAHKVTLELHNNDHTPLLNSAGNTVAASVAFITVAGSSGAPSIAITSPTGGATVALGVDVNRSVPVVFTTKNFTLAAAGTGNCGSGCGHVNLTIDGAACNTSGMPYNATGSASPINALFGLCSAPAGTHTIAIELRNNDDTPVNGVAAASVSVTTN